MGFIHFFFKILFYYFLFIIIFRMVIFLFRYFLGKKKDKRYGRYQSRRKRKDNYSTKEKIIDAEFEEIE